MGKKCTGAGAPGNAASSPARLICRLGPCRAGSDNRLISCPKHACGSLVGRCDRRSTTGATNVDNDLVLGPLPKLSITTITNLSFLLSRARRFAPSATCSRVAAKIPRVRHNVCSGSGGAAAGISAGIHIACGGMCTKGRGLALNTGVSCCLARLSGISVANCKIKAVGSTTTVGRSVRKAHGTRIKTLGSGGTRLKFNTIIKCAFSGVCSLCNACGASTSSVLPSSGH